MARRHVALFVVSTLAACGGMSGSGVPGAPAFTISASGLSPRSVEVMGGECLMFENTDMVAHEVSADDASACPELMQPGPLSPGATWNACLAAGPKTCSFHDAARSAPGGAPDPAFAGTIRVDASMDPMPSMPSMPATPAM